MKTLNCNYLRCFRAVAHEGNLPRAVDRLHVPPSAVPVQIQKLEREPGHALLERRSRQLILPAAGRIALDRADAIFAMSDQLVGMLQSRGRASVS